MEDGKVLYTMVENTCILKFVGAIVYRISPCFDRFLSKVQKESKIEKFIIDLSEACHIDSTNLGLLARLHAYSASKTDQPPTLVSTNENISEVLKNTGFSKMFTVLDSLEEIDVDFKELPKEEMGKKGISDIMLNAHRELAKLNETNKETFKDVIKYLEEESLNNLSFSN